MSRGGTLTLLRGELFPAVWGLSLESLRGVNGCGARRVSVLGFDLGRSRFYLCRSSRRWWWWRRVSVRFWLSPLFSFMFYWRLSLWRGPVTSPELALGVLLRRRGFVHRSMEATACCCWCVPRPPVVVWSRSVWGFFVCGLSVAGSSVVYGGFFLFYGGLLPFARLFSFLWLCFGSSGPDFSSPLHQLLFDSPSVWSLEAQQRPAKVLLLGPGRHL